MLIKNLKNLFKKNKKQSNTKNDEIKDYINYILDHYESDDITENKLDTLLPYSTLVEKKEYSEAEAQKFDIDGYFLGYKQYKVPDTDKYSNFFLKQYLFVRHNRFLMCDEKIDFFVLNRYKYSEESMIDHSQIFFNCAVDIIHKHTKYILNTENINNREQNDS